ncbi:hypothetical protein [Leisingera aquaemixtae]|uniref:Uncharacterized protein n=1 Tax=Leisingera aquaemixtae TaxID=1396826 RepID=A0A0P1HCC5_9RHOB|nr:hypothetical protein [Leisingera aquaemixtae]CUI01126.1 hypothetical protein PHA8399_03267 [Leisingera aquaemixtae]
MLEGKKTYIIAAMILLSVLVEKGLGIDVPGIEVGDDWFLLVLNALGLGTLRSGINSGLLNRFR